MKAILSVVISIILVLQSICFLPLDTAAAETEDTSEANAESEEADPNAEEAVPEESSSGVSVEAPSAVLMEASTGQMIFEKNGEERLPPASVTKIMTLLLIFDAVEEGRITLEDTVTVSEYAASMGGSQVFLEQGEEQTVDTMIKCIAVSSANDACVAMAEFIDGSEEEFVRKMNVRAKELSMTNTNFVNCNGLDAENHLTTAKDIALMSRELITKYPSIHEYSMIWMENITHNTSKGTTEFGLSNTNKMVRQYAYTTGLKTGSTSAAKFCISATAKKDDLELIAVIMAAPDPKMRIKDATRLLDYGFGKCKKYIDTETMELPPVPVTRGTEKTVSGSMAETFQYIDQSGADIRKITKKAKMTKQVKAPVKKGETIGKVSYYLEGENIGSVKIKADKAVPAISFKSALAEIANCFLL